MTSGSDTLQGQAEILKLARVLGRPAEDLEYLKQVPTEDVRALRDQITDLLFTADGHTIDRLAGASKLLPVGVIATISERAFGPLLSARVAAKLDPRRAVEVAAKLPPAFLADVAIEIDPRRTSDVIGQIEPNQIAEVARELVRRQEYVTMGRFVGHLSDAAIAATVAAMDDTALLHVTFVLEDMDGLERLIDLLSEDRLDGLVATVIEQDLWDQALAIAEQAPALHAKLAKAHRS